MTICGVLQKDDNNTAFVYYIYIDILFNVLINFELLPRMDV